MLNLSAATRALIVALLLALLSACAGSSAEQETETLPVDQLYAEAKSSLDNGNFERSIRYYKRLTSRFPFGDITEQAQLDLAYAQYRRAEYDDAISTVNRFIKTYPAHAKIDYAYYLRGLVNFDRNRSYIDRLIPSQAGNRDQESARQAFNDFGEMLRRYPNSSYAPDARQRMTYILNSLAEYEVHVARYYYSRGAYVAAINRAQIAMTEYQNVPAIEDALGILVNSYNALGMDQLRDDARRVLEKNYPKSLYLTQGFKSRTQPWWKLW